jgi:hypothetical protein
VLCGEISDEGEQVAYFVDVSLMKKSDNGRVSCFIVVCNNTSAKRNDMLRLEFSS